MSFGCPEQLHLRLIDKIACSTLANVSQIKYRFSFDDDDEIYQIDNSVFEELVYFYIKFGRHQTTQSGIHRIIISLFSYSPSL
jgi:hypothetical protein